MKKQLQNAINKYVKAFEKKHDVCFDGFIADDILGIATFSDCYFNIADVVFDLDNKCPKDLIWNWYYESLDETKLINYQSYYKGLRYGQL